MWNTLATQITWNLYCVSLCTLVLLVTFAANFVLSLFHNIKQLNELWDPKKAKCGILKFAVIVIGTALLVVGTTAIPIVCSLVANAAISAEALEAISVGIIIVAFLTSAIYYAKDAIRTLTNILKKVGEDHE